MRRVKRKNVLISLCLLVSFVLWTFMVSCFDVNIIGPLGTEVGFSTINEFVHNLSGVNMSLYILTDWLSLIPLGFVVGFCIIGIIQWYKRKSIFDVDYNILALGGLYIIVMIAYLLFEVVVINYRPVLIDGCMEVSYPSSTTVLVICVMSTAVMQLNKYISNNTLKKVLIYYINLFIVIMIVLRIVSGVHWISDIIGGVLLSAGLVMLYYSFAERYL